MKLKATVPTCRYAPDFFRTPAQRQNSEHEFKVFYWYELYFSKRWIWDVVAEGEYLYISGRSWARSEGRSIDRWILVETRKKHGENSV